MRIAERQEGEDAIVMENLSGHGLMRLRSADGGDQRVMAVIPVRQRNVGFVAQPGVCPIGPHHQARGQHVAALQGDKGVVFAPGHLLQLRGGNQRDVATLLRFLPQRMMNHRIFDDMAEMAVAHALIIKSDMPEAVFIPHFHPVVAARTLGDNF